MTEPALRPRLLVLIAIGIAGGLLSGAFGVGGGIILVPLLLTFAGLDQRRAAATSLFAIMPTTITGSLAYIASGHIDYLAAAIIAVCAIGGSLVGTWLLPRVPIVWLRWGFIGVLLLVAARMSILEPVRGETLEFGVLPALAYALIGVVIGIASGLFGIGGGVIAVPALTAGVGVSDLIAKGTSLLAMVPTSISGSIANGRRGLLVLRTGLVVGISSAIASLGGSAIAQWLPPRPASILFAVLLVGISIQLSIKAVRAQRRGQ